MEELSEWEKLRQKNISALELLVDEELAKPEIQEITKELNLIHKKINKQPEPQLIAKIAEATIVTRKSRNRSADGGSFKFGGKIPIERRNSSRIANKKPQYTADDLDNVEDEVDKLRKNKYLQNTDELRSIDEVVFRPRKSKSFGTRRIAQVPFVAAEDITQSYIKNIAWKVINKEYSADGTSCHQCRQKTKDSKTYCRSGRCIGVRGQFCGVCLNNRYGENAENAIKDPKWVCPPCRKLCNCSICRARQGKRPTGILAPIAQNQGFKSVADFLKYLQKMDSTIEPLDHQPTFKKIEGVLLGFDDDDEPVMASNVSLEE